MDAQSSMFQRLVHLRDLGFNPAGILDIGAHDGNFSRGARQIFPNANILMIDALLEKEPVLASTCEELGNADYVIALLGDKETDATPFFVVNAGAQTMLKRFLAYTGLLSTPKNAEAVIKTGSSKFRENSNFPKEKRLLPQRTLGSILANRNSSFELVKLDVQGAELDILRGLGRHLSKLEVILMEMSLVDYNAGSPLIEAVLSELRKLDFVLYDIVEEHRVNGHLFQIDGLFVHPSSRLRPRPPFTGWGKVSSARS